MSIEANINLLPIRQVIRMYNLIWLGHIVRTCSV